jgi:uncharacterized protein YbjT (DUF2867 family)
MIVVTGATGQLGRLIVENLVRRVPAAEVGISVRDPAKAGDLAALGVRVRTADYAQPDTLPAAFEGATQVLLVSSNAGGTGGDPLAQHRSAIDAARAAGVRRIVYTSQIAASPSSAFGPARDHAATEEMLRTSGLAWTALRNGFYASSGLQFIERGLAGAAIVAPADGKVSWTTHEDLAAAAAAVLATDGSFDGPTPPLTASAAHDFGDLAVIASELLGRPIARTVVADDTFRDQVASQFSPARAAIFLSYYAASRANEFAAVDPTLERLIGRAPISMRDFLAQKLAG